MPNDCRSKVTLGTRRSGGIGTAIAQRLARAGARVATGRSRDPEGTPLLVDAPTTRALAHSRPDAGQEGSRLVRIWETNFDLARRDELVAYANEISLPVLRTCPGCTGVMFFTREDWWITQTIWRDHKSIDALTVDAAYARIVEGIIALNILGSATMTKDYDTAGGSFEPFAQG